MAKLPSKGLFGDIIFNDTVQKDEQCLVSWSYFSTMSTRVKPGSTANTFATFSEKRGEKRSALSTWPIYFPILRCFQSMKPPGGSAPHRVPSL